MKIPSKNSIYSLNRENLKEIWKFNLLIVGTSYLSVLLILFLFLDEVKLFIIISLKTGFYMFVNTSLQTVILQYTASRFGIGTHKFKRSRYPLSYFAGIVSYLVSWCIFAQIAGLPVKLDDIKLLSAFILVASILTTIVLSLHNFLIFRFRKTQIDIEYSNLIMRSAEAENLLLKQQIHPHFLFNALNTLDALYIKDLELGTSYLVKLAAFLRATISQHQRVATTLEEELSICSNYMAMQKIRFGIALEWEIKIEDQELLKGSIPSFSLQPLVENAIKHNMFSKVEPLKIVVEQKGNTIMVSNKISRRKSGEVSSKSGLANLADRYRIWSGEEISVRNDGAVFQVTLKIIRNENSNY